MGPFDPNDIPGYAEAVAKERAARNLAMMNQVPIAGITCNQLSLRSYVMLVECENIFLLGGTKSATDISLDAAIFLWFLSPEYCLDLEKRDAFVKSKIETVKFKTAIDDITEYVAMVFWDAPGRSNRPMGPDIVSSAASIIDLIAGEYGWDDESIMQKPLARLFQYMRLILSKNGRPVLNYSDRIKSEWLREQMNSRQTN